MHFIHAGLTLSGFVVLCNANPLGAAGHGVCDHFKCERAVADAAEVSTIDTEIAGLGERNAMDIPTTTITRIVGQDVEAPGTATVTVDIWDKMAARSVHEPVITTITRIVGEDAEAPGTTTGTVDVWNRKAARSAEAPIITTITRIVGEVVEAPGTTTVTVDVWNRKLARSAEAPVITTITRTFDSEDMQALRSASSPETTTITIDIWNKKKAVRSAEEEEEEPSPIHPSPIVNAIASGPSSRATTVIPGGPPSALPLKSRGRRAAHNPFSPVFPRDKVWWNPWSKDSSDHGHSGHREDFPCPCSEKEWAAKHKALEGCSWKMPCVDITMPCPCEEGVEGSPRCDPELPCLDMHFPCPCEPGEGEREWGWWVANKCDWTMECEYYPDSCTPAHPEFCTPLGYWSQ